MVCNHNEKQIWFRVKSQLGKDFKVTVNYCHNHADRLQEQSLCWCAKKIAFVPCDSYEREILSLTSVGQWVCKQGSQVGSNDWVSEETWEQMNQSRHRSQFWTSSCLSVHMTHPCLQHKRSTWPSQPNMSMLEKGALAAVCQGSQGRSTHTAPVL